MNGFLLWVAQGFGVGRIPFAPGTFGSALGFLWVALLLLPGSVWFFVAASLAGAALSVPVCAAGEKALQQKDPGSVVFDEIVAIPICFAGWIALLLWRTGGIPEPGYFVQSGTWPVTAGLFAAFRFFDVLKPWPVKQSQSLPGGFGVTVDDLLAAVYVNLAFFVACGLGAVQLPAS